MSGISKSTRIACQDQNIIWHQRRPSPRAVSKWENIPGTCNMNNRCLISNFRLVLNVVWFLLGKSPASEFYMPTFRNTLFHLHRQVGAEWLGLSKVGVLIREKVWLENSLSQNISRINTPTISNLVIIHTHPPMKMEQTEFFETSAYKIHMPGNYPEQSIQWTTCAFQVFQ